MTVHVHRSAETGWTKLANTVLRDPDLSLRAKGLLVQLLSHEDGWQQSIRYAESQCRDGKDAIGAGLKELIEAGYVTRERVQEGSGRFRGYRYDVYDTRAGSTPELSGFTVSGRTGYGVTDYGESAPLVEPQELEEPQEQKNPDLKQQAPASPGRSLADALLAPDSRAMYFRQRLLDRDQARWIVLSPAAVMKLGKEFGASVVIEALSYVYEQPDAAEDAYPYLLTICRRIVDRGAA